MAVIVPTPATGLGYGGAEYGYSPYGSGGEAREPYPVSGGYGGHAYGYHSYGSVDVSPPRVSSAISIDGYRVEVFFTEAMRSDAALLDAASYTFVPTTGAPVTVTGVEEGTAEDGGVTSVILTHTGTTLGGRYQVQVAATLVDVVGNLVVPTARTANLLALGATPTFVAAPADGSHILLTFSEDVLPEAEFSPGVESTDAYGVETDYPVGLTVTSVEHPVDGDAARVRLTVEGMTSATYDLTVSPAEAVAYDGTTLPSAATAFEGVEVGTGSSTAGGSGLLLTKAAGVTYGWDFSDTSGRVLPASSYRVDVTVDASAAVYTPSLYDAALGTLTVSDGAVQATVTLTRVANVDVIEVSSGGFFVQVPAAWSTGEVVLTLLRNQKAAVYALLLDGVPLVSGAVASFTGVPSITPGVRFVLGSSYAATQFPVRAVSFTATQTVFSASWNFLHGVAYSFVGSAALTRPSVLTKRGPLVKDWGDPTPATKADVEVRVNGTPVAIQAVNPYLGLITPTIPIPLTSPGTTTVDVDYAWFPNPALPMPGLNTLGVVLNKWDLHQGWHPPAQSPVPSTARGVADTQRFPMGLVLPPLRRQRPILIGHRYIGFEKSYTAALNSPTTLLLNQNPHRIARDTLTQSPEDVSVSYEGDVLPGAASDPWTVAGTDTGHLGTGTDAGYYFVKDASADSAAFYARAVDYSFPATTHMAARLQVTEWTADGVFSGVGFGFHNDRFLYLVGFLEVNGVKHVGLLRDATRPYLLGSWTVGPSFEITVTSATTFTTSAAVFTAMALHAGVVFQVFDGSQAGVYTVVECGVSVDGEVATVTIDSSNPFPANPNRWGNKTATAVLGVPWDEAVSSYRLVADVEAGSAQVYVGGALSGLAVSASRVSAYPAQTVLLLPTRGQGAVFWGSMSGAATNTSRWGLVRYGITYDQANFHFQGIVVAAEMSEVPSEDANHEWFVSEDFGYAEIDATGDTLLLKGTANSSEGVLDTTFGYGRLEPFLTNQVLADVDATFRVDSGILGAGDAQVRFQNGERSVLFSTILYVEGGSPYRRLVEVPSVAITGIRTPEDDGWSTDGSGLVVDVRNLPLELVQEDGASQLFYKVLDTTSPDITGGRIAEARLRFDSHTGLAVNDGPIFGCTVGPSFRDVALQFLAGQVRFVTRVVSDGDEWHGVGSAVPFEWDDDAEHTYRIIADPTTATVVLVVDDTVLATVPLSSFTATTQEGRAYFGAVATSTATESAVEWTSFSVVSLPPVAAKRTLGVLKNLGDPSSIDGWEIPRTDSFDVPNSDASAVVEEMDWRSDVQVRVRLDPGWGVTVFRPDLPPPPYYTGEFATQYTEPSAGWINLEYRHLPRVLPTQRFGRVEFGSLDPRAITQQRWSEVRYRLYTRSNEDFIAPQNMVLNWCNVVTSGELLRDTSPEVLEVESISATLVSLAPTHVHADRVFNVVVGSTVLNPTDWTFDPDTQAITLSNPLPAANTVVTVAFAAGKPVTNTYLCSQPLLQSTTLLNEGTPPVPKSQVGTATREEVFGSALNDPTDTLGTTDFILNDPFRSVQFTDDSGALYEALEFCEVDDGNDANLIAPMSDGPAPEEGWIELALSGTSFSDAFSLPGGPKATRGSNVARDTVGGFNQANMLLAAGGVRGGGTLNASIMYPSYPAIPGPDRGATARSMTMRMRMSSVLTDANDPVVETQLADDLAFATTATDDDPPTSPDPTTDPNPTGTGGAGGHGACVAEMVDASTTTYSRLGPWGGEAALAVRSRLSGNGYPASGMGLVLVGGAPLGGSVTRTVLNIKAAN